jgi:hypothetical protein
MCAGVEEIPCEQVREQHFLGLGVPAKQLRSWRKGMGVERESGMGWVRPGEQGQCWERTQSESRLPIIGSMHEVSFVLVPHSSSSFLRGSQPKC